MTLEHQILATEPEKLGEVIVQMVEKQGEQRVKNILLFTIAGHIKRTMPKLSWKKARELARKLPTLVSVSA